MSNVKNTCLRFNIDKPIYCKAWEILQTSDKSHSKLIAEALAEYHDRHSRLADDPYFESREREDRFVEQIVSAVGTALEKTLPSFLTACLVNITQPYKEIKHIYTEKMLQNICLGLYSMCKGAEAKYFDGYTNIKSGDFVCFGVKGIMDTNKKLKNTLLFNILSYMNDQLLGRGNTVAAIDETYLFLSNMTAIEYIRNGMKRVRKKDSAFILASQNLNDFLLPEIQEYTKPLFSISMHHFLFNPGNIQSADFINTLQLEQSEYDLIKFPERGTCLYRCGNERYLLMVKAPKYKAELFGSAGGR